MSDIARRGVIESEIIEPGYGVAHKTFHWLIFLLLAAQYTVGSIIPHIGRDTQDTGWVHVHQMIVPAILFFVVLRVVCRFMCAVRVITLWVGRLTLGYYAHLSLWLPGLFIDAR